MTNLNKDNDLILSLKSKWNSEFCNVENNSTNNVK